MRENADKINSLIVEMIAAHPSKVLCYKTPRDIWIVQNSKKNFRCSMPVQPELEEVAPAAVQIIFTKLARGSTPRADNHTATHTMAYFGNIKVGDVVEYFEYGNSSRQRA